jgi:exodeoxyribonuclease VII large subunit
MFPRTVGIVTSPTGAVIRDFLNIVSRRHSGLNVLLCPASVQGDSAPAEIEAALAELNSGGLVDLIVIARGGGSLEDLAAFNSERVARAISSSRLPVVSAVGHETDFTIADFVADLRAPTPSAAAELITEAQFKIAEYLAAQFHRLERAASYRLLQSRQRLARVEIARAESRLSAFLHRYGQRLDDAILGLDSAMSLELRQRQNRVVELAALILHHDPRPSLAHAREHLADFRAHLERSLERLLESFAARLGALDARLHSLSPLAVLDRGYALVFSGQGALIRSAAQLAIGDHTTTRLADGTFTSQVETTAPDSPSPEKRSKKSRS